MLYELDSLIESSSNTLVELLHQAGKSENTYIELILSIQIEFNQF